ncbi:MAG: hypothetical protein CMH57_05070 [Myxococcales bacterium]|nr:hypothetical protein [Myxococcales bacterium]
MSLRENTIYIRLSSYHDLIDDATHVEILHRLDAWNRGPFQHYQNLQMRGRPKALTAEVLLNELHGMVGQGLHRATRFKLWRDEGAPVRSFEVFAGAHPYTGVFHTQIDIRVERSWFERNPTVAPERCRRMMIALTRLTHPFQGHAHDTDDNSIQNIDNPNLLRRGFGVESDEPIELADNPGRETSRGERRYVVNWLTLMGPELIEQVGLERVRSAPAWQVDELDVDPEARKLPGVVIAERMGSEEPQEEPQRWILLQTAPTPLEPEAPERREAQRQVREHLGFHERARRDRMMGYWQRKP